MFTIQGKSFKELIGFRYTYLTDAKKRQELRRALSNNEISQEQFESLLSEVKIKFSPIPQPLPKRSLGRAPGRFNGVKFNDLNYDLIVYDTYDFIDRVISFSLSDVYVAAFKYYADSTGDERGISMCNYFRYGTDSSKEIWLLRYGFSSEEVVKILPYVDEVDENEISFSSGVDSVEGMENHRLMLRYA